MAWGNNENKLKACQSCRALIPASAAECESCGAAGHHKVEAGSLTDPLALLGDWPVTMILMLVNVAVYAWVLIYQTQFSGEGGSARGFAFEPLNFPDVLGAFGSVSAPAVRRSGEWWRLLFDNGFILGSLLVCYRLVLAGSIGLAALRAWQGRSTQSLMFASAAFMGLLNGQWGQATSLGGAVIGGGLALAAANLPAETNSPPSMNEQSRRLKKRRPRKSPPLIQPSQISNLRPLTSDHLVP